MKTNTFALCFKWHKLVVGANTKQTKERMNEKKLK